MRKNTLALAVAASALLSTSVMAQSPNWNSVDVGYAKGDVEDFEPDGFALKGSALVSEDVFVMADYTALSDEVMGVDTDLDWTRLGVGYRYATSDVTDVYGRVTYENLEAKASFQGSSASEDEDGYGLTVGIRSRLTDKIELDGNIGYLDIGDESDTAINLSANYFVTEQVAVGVNYTNVDDLDIVGASLRYAF